MDRKTGYGNSSGSYIGFNADVASITDYYPFGMPISERTIISATPFSKFGYNGQLRVDEIAGIGNSIDYKARQLDTRLGRFWSVDPLTKKFPMLTPYQFASNIPIWGVDLDGEEVRIYTESPKYYKVQVGHTFISVGSDKDLTVYTYGRYANIDAPSGGNSGSLNGLSPSGQGVLIKYTGAAAKDFINKSFNSNKMNVYEITDANDAETATFFENKFNSPNATIPTTGSHENDPNARVIDEYDLFNNNCTTISIEGVNAGGSKVFKETTQEIMKTRTIKVGMDYEVELEGTGKYKTTSIPSKNTPYSPAGAKKFLDYQKQAPQNNVKEVTDQVKP